MAACFKFMHDKTSNVNVKYLHHNLIHLISDLKRLQRMTWGRLRSLSVWCAFCTRLRCACPVTGMLPVAKFGLSLKSWRTTLELGREIRSLWSPLKRKCCVIYPNATRCQKRTLIIHTQLAVAFSKSVNMSERLINLKQNTYRMMWWRSSRRPLPWTLDSRQRWQRVKSEIE